MASVWAVLNDKKHKDGSFSHFSDYRMEPNCRIDFIYRLSYANCQILMCAAFAMREPSSPGSNLYDALQRELTFRFKRRLSLIHRPPF